MDSLLVTFYGADDRLFGKAVLPSVEDSITVGECVEEGLKTFESIGSRPMSPEWERIVVASLSDGEIGMQAHFRRTSSGKMEHADFPVSCAFGEMSVSPEI